MPDERSKSSPLIRGITEEIQQAAWELRDRLTLAEERLWQALRGRRLAGLKFRRQHPVGPLILDFYCPARKLVVELDGEVHDRPAQRERDDVRTARLKAYGYRVIRFRNEEVLEDLSSVLKRIEQAAMTVAPDGLPPVPQ